jgi:hypothetical protein
MNRRLYAWLAVLMLAGCRPYQYQPKMASQDGLTPPDQFARYGREQAEAVAIGREFARARQGDSREALARQAEAAMTYARSLPDVVDVHADPLGYRLTVQFRTGWRAGIAPIDDGKSGAETPGIGAAAAPKS